MATTIRIPCDLVTVAVNSANCFWSSKSGANLDQAYIAYMDSGLGSSVWCGYVPSNVAGTPSWNLEAYHTSNAGSGGNTILNVFARTVSHGSLIDVAPTMIVNSAVIVTNSANIENYSALSGGNFDSVVALSASNYVYIKVNRAGGDTNDTLSDQWNLKMLVMRIDIE